MKRLHPTRDYITVRAELRSIELAGGRRLPTASPQDIRNAKARREIEWRQMEKEARQ